MSLCYLHRKKLCKIHYYITEPALVWHQRKKMYMLPPRTHTSYPSCIPTFTVLSGQAWIQASMQLRHCAAGAKSLPHASYFVFSVKAKIVSLKNCNKSLFHYKKHILLIFEHHGSLESNFSILPLWFWHRKVLIWLQKATFTLKVSVRDNKTVNSIIKPENRRNVFILCYHLWHNICFVNNNYASNK